MGGAYKILDSKFPMYYVPCRSSATTVTRTTAATAAATATSTSTITTKLCSALRVGLRAIARCRVLRQVQATGPSELKPFSNPGISTPPPHSRSRCPRCPWASMPHVAGRAAQPPNEFRNVYGFACDSSSTFPPLNSHYCLAGFLLAACWPLAPRVVASTVARPF